MPRIVISFPLISWFICSFAALTLLLVSLPNPQWLRRVNTAETRRLAHCSNSPNFSALAYQPPSIGPWFRCQIACNGGERNNYTFDWYQFEGITLRCQLSLWGFGQQTSSANKLFWAASLLIFIGFLLLLVASFLVVMSFCIREINDKSIFSIAGILQCLSNLLMLSGLFLWPASWDSVPVREVCGGSASSYTLGNCSISWIPVAAAFGIILLFISAMLSAITDRSILSYFVFRQMLLNGKKFLFV